MAPATKKRRVSTVNTDGLAKHDANGTAKIWCPITAPSIEEKSTWPGFCEIESEPAFFNIMLKDFGVKGVKVREVFGLDEELLAMLPQPIYGLIFLYRYRSDDINNQEATCPDNVWFANQISDYSCATVSLLNIINNVPNIELGAHLQSFRDFTQHFPPALRGDVIANFEFVKQVHNSFARRMDMLNIDLAVKNGFDDRRKSKAAVKESPAKTKHAKKNKSVVTDDDWESNDAAFHFSAYVPIDGDVWKLDGLDRQPQRLVKYESIANWLSTITPIIDTRMCDYAAGNIEFSLLSLVRDPLIMLRVSLARNIKSIESVEARLDTLNPDWRTLLHSGGESEEEIISGQDTVLDISSTMVQEAIVDKLTSSALEQEDCDGLINVRRTLAASQRDLRVSVMEEINSAADDEKRAKDRRCDYSPFIYTWLRMLAQKEGLMADLAETTK